ncbi:nucleotidyltransferase family protein [Microbacterium sp.]|uniref:nucleotidyltransferase family protein n=1 Tax=Microbacterium sp. TaxID=51671 RepID=UPI00333E9ADC
MSSVHGGAPVRLGLREGGHLAHALVAHVAEQAGIRTLAIKGPVADHYGLREPRVSADADVLVEPARFSELCQLLMENSWHPRHERSVPTLMDQHSVTLICDRWPNDIDVHEYFPGFFGDRGRTFDRLWSTRRTLPLAHVDVPVPSRAGAAVIGALHSLRYTRSLRHNDELERITRIVSDEFDDEQREDFVQIVQVGGAQWVMRDVLAAIGVEAETDATARQRQLWTLNRETVEDGAAVSWLAAMRQSPWAEKPGVLFRALWISRADIPRNDPDIVPTAREAWQHRLVRWRRGTRALLHYVWGSVRRG